VETLGVVEVFDVGNQKLSRLCVCLWDSLSKTFLVDGAECTLGVGVVVSIRSTAHAAASSGLLDEVAGVFDRIGLTSIRVRIKAPTNVVSDGPT
jgi:hypothetical protein